MTRTDIDHLFELLRIYFPNNPRTRSEREKSAWLLMMEPYEPKEIKRALVERLQRVPHFPDPQAITAKCSSPTQERLQDECRYIPLGRVEMEHLECARAWQEEWHTQLHTMALPTFHEATEQGMSAAAWNRMLEEAGVWDIQTELGSARSSSGTSG